MKSLFITTILMLFAICLNGQTDLMNIYKSDGIKLQIPLNDIDSVTYTYDVPNISLYTLPVTDITDSSATTGGNIVADGGSPITNRGVVWDTKPNPTLSNETMNSNSSWMGSYSLEMNNLEKDTVYYVRAYATNTDTTVYGNERVFVCGSNVTYINGNGVTDVEGNFYPSVIVGGQEWMVENLNTSKFNNGDVIPYGTIGSDGIGDNPAWIYFNNDSSYGNTPHGKLYNYFVIEDNRKICPTGWHVPDNYELTLLTDYLGGVNVAGLKVRDISWSGTNESGLSFLPSGFLEGIYFRPSPIFAIWSGEPKPNTSWTADYLEVFSSGYSLFPSGGFSMRSALSIRCIKD